MPNGEETYVRQLSLAHWFITHKFLLKNVLIVALIVANLALVSYDLFLVINNLVLGQKDYQAILSSLINPQSDYAALRENKLPTPLTVSNLRTLANEKGFDIIADLDNLNTKWFATFDFQFRISDQLTPIKAGFIFPGEKKMIFDLAVDNGNLASDVVITNVRWTKEINFAALKEQKFRFDVKNAQFIPSGELGIGEKISVNRVTFDVTNSSAYNFANVNFVLVLNSNNQMVAFNQVASGIFSSGNTLHLASTFFQKLPRIDNVQIIPDVNILDPNIFLKF